MRQKSTALFRAIFCAFVLLGFAATAHAQFRAGVQGTVSDPTGAVVGQATVTLTNNGTGKTQQTTTSGEGFYRFSELPPGTYTVTVEKTGFKKNTVNDVIVNAEQVQGLDVTLTTGEVSESVTVTASAAPALETENPSLDKAITTAEVRELPQFGRDPYELTRLTPGVFGEGARGANGNAANLPNQPGPGGSTRSIFQTENQVQISADGQRVTANNFQIDGTSVNSLTHGGAAVITPNQESVKEVRVIANTYSAEYGRNSGAQVLTVSQNGTNQFHGSLFLKNDSPGLNSFNKYGGFNNAPPTRVNNHLNQFGGSFGGPLPLPDFRKEPTGTFHLGRDKAFFFFSYEALRQNTSDTVNSFIETSQYRALVEQIRPGSIAATILGSSGIEPRVVGVIPVPCTAAGFAANSTGCRQVAGGLDIGSPTGARGQYVLSSDPTGAGLDGIPDVEFAQLAIPARTRGDQYNLRFDFNLTQKDTLTLSGYRSRFFGQQAQAASNARPEADITTNPLNTFGMITYTRVLSPTMINEARVNATRFAFNELQSSSSTNFGIPNIQIESFGLPGALNKVIQIGAPYSETTPGIFAENTFEFRDTLRKVIGNQAYSFGFEWGRDQDNNNLVGAARPLYTFGGLFNFANDTPLFYQIAANPTTGGPPVTQRYFRATTIAAFVQNDWKIRPNLTLNLGLRYEYFSPLSEKNNTLSNLVLGPAGGQELTGARIVTGINQLYPPDRNNFAPRVGFAYTPNYGDRFGGLFKEGRVVLRGGFAVMYNRIPFVDFTNVRANPPFEARYTICCGTGNEFSTPFADNQILYALGANNTPFSYPANPALILNFNANGIPTNTQGGTKQVEVYGAPSKVPTPYVYAYSLDSQYALPWKLTADVGYQGSAGRKMVRLVNQRFIFPNDPGTFFASGVFFPTPDGTSNYNALLLNLLRRFSNGFQLTANYRWSKSIDIVSSDEVGAPTNPTFPLDVRQERGPSDYDVRHYFVASALYDLPFLAHRKDLLGTVFGGWEVTGIATYHTGFPWTPVVGNCPSTNRPIVCPARPTAYFGGAGTDTSNDAFITGSNFPGGGSRFFTTVGATGFGPVAGLLPGVGRNSFRGPKYKDVDMTLAKRFSLARFINEGSNLEIRANFFNVFNILNLQSFPFASSSTTVTDPHFGISPGALAGRVIEFQGRFNF
ncbi:MAG TPA: TonB-dependent receptor [Pyrinomonadaceae bacterium]|nr:TonB-dependent receptor [Pyrinomonadaceae bacterium]